MIGTDSILFRALDMRLALWVITAERKSEGNEGEREGGREGRFTCTIRAVSGMAVRARIGMEGRYLAIRRGVEPVSVSTTIILALMSKAVLTEDEATDSGATICPTTAMTVLRMVFDLEGGREGGKVRWTPGGRVGMEGKERSTTPSRARQGGEGEEREDATYIWL